MRRRGVRSASRLAGTVALAVASTLLATVTTRALRVWPMPIAESRSSAASLTVDAESGQVLLVRPSSESSLGSDPFSQDRRPLREGDAEPPRDRAPLQVSSADLRLLGTVVNGAAGFAVCQLATDAPRIVRIGERIGDLTLISVEQARALFRTPSGVPLAVSLSPTGA